MEITESKEYRLLPTLSFKMHLSVYVFYLNVTVCIKRINQRAGWKMGLMKQNIIHGHVLLRRIYIANCKTLKQ